MQPGRGRGAGPHRVAIACSGLGHIQRGIEAWAVDLAATLRQGGTDAELFSGAPGPGHSVGCMRRGGRAARVFARLARNAGGWRYGMGSPYEVEQLSFAAGLWHRIRAGYDLLHVQDPLVARLLDTAHRRGLSAPKVILANGTDEPQDRLSRMRYLQELTPQAAKAWQARPARPRKVYAIPNFIDTDAFSPGDQAEARRSLGLPLDGPIILCCAAIRAPHKRINHLVAAFATALPSFPSPPLLVVAGAREADTDAIVRDATARLGSRVRFLVDLPRSRMAQLYRAADVFTLASLHEAFGIVLLEAMASSLPVLCHDTPGFRYVVGPCGLFANLSQDDSFASALVAIVRDRASLAPAARPHVQATFSKQVVAAQIEAMYADVLTDDR